jgi:OmpA-OmpF porin, OOP family
MKNLCKLVAASFGLLTSAVHADAPPNYLTFMGSYVLEDEVRAGDHGLGGMFLYGSPINDWLSLELGGWVTSLERDGSSDKDRQYAFGLDLLGGRSYGTFTPFVVGGLGVAHEDFEGNEEELSPYVDLGAGVLVGLTRQLKLRGEARYYALFNGQSYPDTDVVYDAHLNVGLQWSFGEETPRAVMPVAAAEPAPYTEPAPMMADNDLDHDGVPNDRDRCPDTPAGLAVDENGCALQGSSTIILRNVHFDFDKADLKREARDLLDSIVAGFNGQPTMEVELAGHTDALGTQSYNLGLSQRRADAVRTYLISKGIADVRVHAEGYGEFQPIADNETEEGRAQNRRVEFKVIHQ